MRLLLIASITLGFSVTAAILPFSLRHMNPMGSQSGNTYNSVDHPNAVFVFESYFLNCPYCNDNAPNVDALAEEFGDNPRVQVLDIGIDRTDAEYAEWILRHNPNHPVLHDGARALTRQLGTTSYPTVYVVKNGAVLLKATGVWSASTKARIRSTIASALAENVETLNDGESVPLHSLTATVKQFAITYPGLAKVVKAGVKQTIYNSSDCLVLHTDGVALTDTQVQTLGQNLVVKSGSQVVALSSLLGSSVYYLADLGQFVSEITAESRLGTFQNLTNSIVGTDQRNLALTFSRGCQLVH